MKKTLATLFLFMPAFAVAYVGHGSNLHGTYPSFNEVEPTPPYSRDEWQADRYRRDVEEYVENAERYLKNVEEDQRNMRDAANDAIRKANDVVEEYNRWVRGY